MHTRFNELAKLLNMLFASLPLRFMHLIINQQILKRIIAKVSLFLVSLNSCEIFNALRSISLLPLSLSFATTPSCMWHTHRHTRICIWAQAQFPVNSIKRTKAENKNRKTENSKEAKKQRNSTWSPSALYLWSLRSKHRGGLVGGRWREMEM